MSERSPLTEWAYELAETQVVDQYGELWKRSIVKRIRDECIQERAEQILAACPWQPKWVADSEDDGELTESLTIHDKDFGYVWYDFLHISCRRWLGQEGNYILKNYFTKDAAKQAVEEAVAGRLSNHVVDELRKRHGDPLPRHMHLSCGWGGDELTKDGRCPKCGEAFPPP